MYSLTDALIKKLYKNRILPITAKDVITALGYTPAGLSDNLVLDPIGLGNEYWTFHNVSVERGHSDPVNGRNAIKLTNTGSGDGVLETSTINRPLKTIGTKYKFSVWLKSDSACEIAIVIRQRMNGFMNRCNLTTEWKEFSVEHVYEEDYPLRYSQAVVGGWNTFREDHPPVYVYCPKITIIPS